MKFRRNIDDYFAEKSIYFDQLEVYFQLFTQTPGIVGKYCFSRTRVEHPDSMLFSLNCIIHT